MSSSPPPGRRVVVVDGCRTPFLRSGTDFRKLTAYDLGRMAISGLLARNAIDPAAIDLLIMGTVVADPSTSNVARECALAAGVPPSVPAYTVTAACISANVAFQNAVNAIATGSADVAVAGGTETLSDVPIRFSRPIRERLIAAQKARGPGDYLKLLAGLRPKHLAPDVPAIADFSTGLTMGQNAERLAKRLGISREDQDDYAMTSHLRAARATAEGRLRGTRSCPRESAPEVPTDHRGQRHPGRHHHGETGEACDRLSIKRFGTITAGNSSFLTDGGSAVLLMSEDRRPGRSGPTPAGGGGQPRVHRDGSAGRVVARTGVRRAPERWTEQG